MISREDNKLFKTLEYKNKTATDSRFLYNLSEWINNTTGNVNVAMRLKILSNKLK